MSDAQAERLTDGERREWLALAHSKERMELADPWPADREQVRDETLRPLYEKFGAVRWRESDELATTADVARWALASDFAELFLCAEQDFPDLSEDWRADHLSAAAMMRYALLRRALSDSEGEQAVRVTLPNGNTRSMSPGPSSVISKAVIEEFAPRFLARPALIWLSESKRQVVAQDDELARICRLSIDSTRTLPDIILADMGPADPLIVFVEVVATTGPVHDERRRSLLAIATAGGHDPRNVAFVTAFRDRTLPEYRNNAPALATGSFTWFVSEPDNIIHLRSGDLGIAPLSALLGLTPPSGGA